ncbi:MULTISPECIES: hypothetical protein [Halolamina]|uniref:Amphi-Trp domain-containing protein n=1 Tax=Halolamina pelagica TaxID=699431 RepID=A0A1I5NKU6_9EURY|nr:MULTISPECIES: hypothetical protein [Halolamina]NHX36369.1 hypothetical protein [Halolamina sp. R1-12]SFP22419.1 hypothetical protein SAMN05216277_10283 [Halolamina pelagica]
MTDEDSPDDLPAGDDLDHALPAADLQYPTLEFDEGCIDDDGSFDLSAEADREAMSEAAEGVAGALSSHDLAVETEAGYTAFGVGPKSVEASFDPDEGELAVTLRLSAKAMAVDDGSGERVGSRGDAGFVPESMLTDDGDDYRCYRWIDDPESPE